MLIYEREEAVQLLRPAADEGGGSEGTKAVCVFKQHSDLRNVPSGHSRELPAANNALNVSYGRLAPTLLALLQGPDSLEMMDPGNSIP